MIAGCFRHLKMELCPNDGAAWNWVGFFVIVGPLSAVLSQLWGRSADPDCHLQDSAGRSGSGLCLSNGTKAISHPTLP